MTARKAGREAAGDLLALAAKGNYAAIDAVGVVGGPKAVEVLKTLLNQDETELGHAGLPGRQGGSGTSARRRRLEALLEATKSEAAARRHAAVPLPRPDRRAEGGGAADRGADKDPHRLVRAAAADALEQIGGRTAHLAAVATFRKADARAPARSTSRATRASARLPGQQVGRT